MFRFLRGLSGKQSHYEAPYYVHIVKGSFDLSDSVVFLVLINDKTFTYVCACLHIKVSLVYFILTKFDFAGTF